MGARLINRERGEFIHISVSRLVARFSDFQKAYGGEI